MIQVGEVLDKYELLERVGQGGMAIVYRGLDRSLKRVVAVKILHGHLADYQEARDRFEREAQAVAKLRHENILEIFDFAAREGASYIVTEFIDGQTLKQLITDRPITFPEIGAMLIVQVCRALVHAHGAKILHRDIKPENIMIRSDGVVKLMDFGISHMVDLERLTVTGQLLGSPAYMAPEHVEGRPLDFRTDVFAVGIVLYQLCTGKLPFEGKNPHEVLKRIAECKFADPRQVNPRIGNRLGRIILRAMSARPEDRFPAISEMLVALEGYLEESGIAIDKIIAELGRYFNSPGPYEQALTMRLVDHLAREGQRLLADDQRSAALDVFDRVLTIDDKNERVLAIIDGLDRSRRTKKIAIGTIAALAIGGGAYAIHLRSEPPAVTRVPAPDRSSPPVIALGPDTDVENIPPLLDGGLRPIDAPDLDAPTTLVVAPKPDAGAEPRFGDAATPDAGAPKIATRIRISPSTGAEFRLANGPWQPVTSSMIDVDLEKETEITVKNSCCQETARVFKPGERDETGGVITLHTPYLAGNIKPVCALPDVAGVEYEGKQHPIGSSIRIDFSKSTLDTVQVSVVFRGASVSSAPVSVEVGASKTVEVKCVPR